MVPKAHLKKLFSTATMVSLSLSLIAGCSTPPASTPASESGTPTTSTSTEAPAATANLQPKKGGTITIGIANEPDQLDIHKTGMAVANQIAGNLGASLVTQDPDTLEFKPYLAESWEVSEDGKTWTFKIRTGVKFHDGTDMTAKSIAETYQRALDPATAAKVAGSNLSEVESVEAPDDTTLVLHLKQPFAPLLQFLSDPGWLQPLSLQAIAQAGDKYGRQPVGVGPWKFEKWENGQSISFTRNEEFAWADPIFQNQGAPYADRLVYRFISENQTLLAALDSGSIDIARGVVAKDVAKYRDNPQFEVKEMLRNGLGLFVMLNTRRPAFQEIEVRQALNKAINKEAIMKAVIQGEGVVSYGPLPPSLFGYDEGVMDYGLKYQVEEAKALLEKAGYTKNAQGLYEKGGKPLKLDLLTQTGTWAQASQLIQAMLKDIGVEVNIVTLEWGALVDTATKGSFDMTLMGYTLNDPDVLYLFLHSSQADNGLNFSYVKDAKMDELLVKGRTTVDSAARKDVYKEIQKYVVDQAWWVPIYTEKQFNVVRKPVEGVGIHPLRGLMYHDSWVNQ
ncbi:ABC transporter substrate-binding protein [Brevibacillus panacihumi W25]|uniref:ABC transporter substrate-binding protein n=1 Tax=Brevibacillus panacihumi W25 TaxID=1408254 RepID=V6M6D0_9BACL|nr:ABC transporter substrate-binding protein [Brevibacillus panacihumi]EST53450.1 ABC transporter substrate-binding protein [Brevibacillus panacihumi W25]